MSTQEVVQEGPFDRIAFISNSLQRPLAELLATLMHARKRFDPSGPDHGRAGIYQALLGVIDCVRAIIPGRPDLAVPLQELLYGLRSLDDGTTVPLLQAVELDHRPPDAIPQGLFRADAAALMELKVMELRMQKKKKFLGEAVNAVAGRLNQLGFRDSGNRILGKQVADWREHMRKGAQKPDFRSKRYFSLLAELKGKFPEDPKAAFEFLLGCMTEMHAVTIPRKGGS